MDNKEHADKGSQVQKTRYPNLPGSTSHGEIVDVPDELKGQVIGKKGWFLHHIKDCSGAHVAPCSSSNAGFLIRGNDEQREQAKKIIREKLDGTYAKQNPIGKTNKKEITYIPDNLKGLIIGKGGKNLSRTSTETGARLGMRGGEIYIDGSPDEIRKAHIKIKGRLFDVSNVSNAWLLKRRKSTLVDSTNLADKHELQLVPVPSHPWSGPHYKLQLLDDDIEEDNQLDQTETEERLTEEFLSVLKKLQEHESRPEFELVLWCHFGHELLGNVDEGNEGEVFSAQDVRQNLERREWIGRFKTGVEDAEVTILEAVLSKQARSSTYDTRYDFDFYTPSARMVKVKTWLMNKDGADCSMVFALNPAHGLRGMRKRVFCGEPSEKTWSKKPCFFLWGRYQRFLRVDIVTPVEPFDCRFIMCANEKHPESFREEEEEEEVLCEYLSAMQIEKDRVVLPPYRLLPPDFQLIFERRSVRRTYEYLTEAGKFLLTVSRETEKEGDVVDQQDDSPTKTDVLLEFEDWSSRTDEDLFNLDYISAKLPDFIQFVRKVQTIIKLPNTDS